MLANSVDFLRQRNVLAYRIPPEDSLKRYLLPVLAVLVALQVNWLIAPYLVILPLSLAFIAAIMSTAWYAGFRPAMLALVLSALIIDYFFLDPLYSFSIAPAELAALGLFIIECLGIAYCIEYLRKNEDRIRQANTELEHQVADKRAQLTTQEERVRALMWELLGTEERERQNLAAELHDYLAQLLVIARMKNKQAQRSLDSPASDANRYMDETDDFLRQSLSYVRTLMADLHPAELQELGLPAALHWLAAQMSRHGLTVDVSIKCESLPLSHEQAVLLFQSVRELLMNVVKHAGVDRAMVSLIASSDYVLIVVWDNGRGIQAATVGPTEAGQHFGLANVRERMTTLGGTFMLESAVGRGTTVKLRLPLQTTELISLRAASSPRKDRVRVKQAASPDQESLPLH